MFRKYEKIQAIFYYDILTVQGGPINMSSTLLIEYWEMANNVVFLVHCLLIITILYIKLELYNIEIEMYTLELSLLYAESI